MLVASITGDVDGSSVVTTGLEVAGAVVTGAEVAFAIDDDGADASKQESNFISPCEFKCDNGSKNHSDGSAVAALLDFALYSDDSE